MQLKGQCPQVVSPAHTPGLFASAPSVATFVRHAELRGYSDRNHTAPYTESADPRWGVGVHREVGRAATLNLGGVG